MTAYPMTREYEKKEKRRSRLEQKQVYENGRRKYNELLPHIFVTGTRNENIIKETKLYR